MTTSLAGFYDQRVPWVSGCISLWICSREGSEDCRVLIESLVNLLVYSLDFLVLLARLRNVIVIVMCFVKEQSSSYCFCCAFLLSPFYEEGVAPLRFWRRYLTSCQ